MDKETVVHQTTEYYSALKGNELISLGKLWRKFKCISPSEISQSIRITHYIISMV